MTDADLPTHLASARTEACQLYWARRLVDARWANGDYPMLQVMSYEVREWMAEKLVEEINKGVGK
jgi:hypothetical protein